MTAHQNLRPFLTQRVSHELHEPVPEVYEPFEPSEPEVLEYHDPLPEQDEPPLVEQPIDWEPEPPPEPPQPPPSTESGKEFAARRRGRTLHLLRGGDIEEQEVEWLWPRWLPHGFCWLEGDPGSSKSMLAAYLAAIASTARPFPGTESARPPVNVLYLSSGEDPDFVVKRRFVRCGGDLDRFFVLDVHRIMTDHAAGDAAGLPTLPDDAGLVLDTARHCHAKLLIFDAMFSFVSAHVDIFNDHQFRAAIEPFARGASDGGLVILGVRHFTKAQQTRKSQGMGAVAGTAVARSILVMNEAAGDPNTRLLGCAKLSYGARPQGSLAFQIEASGPLDSAWLSYAGEADVTVGRATRLARDDRAADNERLYFTLEKGFTSAFKEHERIVVRGPRKETNVDSLAAKAGYTGTDDFTRSRLGRRLKQALNIHSVQVKEGKTPKWYWTRGVPES